MKNNQFAYGVGLLLLTAATPGQTAESGFYVGAALGQAKQDVGLSNGFLIGFSDGLFEGFVMQVHPDGNEVDNDEWSWSGVIGYRINSYLAAELAYTDFGRAEISERYTISVAPSPFFPSEITRDFTSEVKGPVVSLLGVLPAGAGVDLFLRGGVLFSSQEVDRGPRSIPRSEAFANDVWLGGLGVDWSFAERWGVRLEYQWTGKLDANSTAGETDLEHYSLSVLYRL
ncbi:MAG: outer membrane beta-barrel protein [Steroidobacter sp.]